MEDLIEETMEEAAAEQQLEGAIGHSLEEIETSSTGAAKEIDDMDTADDERKESELEETVSEESEDVVQVIICILKEILSEIETREAMEATYEARSIQHNQYSLFNLRQVLGEFEITDEIYQQMVFRETLVVSKLKESYCDEQGEIVYSSEPEGALCLDIQSVMGKEPKNRIEMEFDLELEEKCDQIHKVIKSDPVPDDKWRQYLNTEVEMYDRELQEQMKETHTKFLVHLSSQVDYNNSNGGSRITAWVDKELHTLEEKRVEWLFVNDNNSIEEKTSPLLEKSLYVSMRNNYYQMKHKSIEDNLLIRRNYSFNRSKYLMCEGSNFLLMRYLAITRHIGSFEMSCPYIDGSLCKNLYDCYGPECGIVNDQKLDVCRIYRTIIEECGLEHKCMTLLTLQGQILKQEWRECDYILQLNPLAYVKNETPSGDEQLITYKIWDQDMQLLSAFLDQKNEETPLPLRSYMDEHPEIIDMILDYMQSVLQMKPDLINDYTNDFFKNYLPLHMARNCYIEQGAHRDDDFLWI